MSLRWQYDWVEEHRRGCRRAFRWPNESNNTAVGYATFSNFFLGGSNNIAIGSLAGIQVEHGNNNIEIGNGGTRTDSGVIRIGTEGTHTAIYLAGIRETPLSHGTAVAVGITRDG